MLSSTPVAASAQAPAVAAMPPAARAFRAATLPDPDPAPPLPAAPGDHYLVIARHRAGNYAPQREQTDLVSRERTVRDIYEGQIDDVASVFVFNPARGTCRDATAEIAREVASLHVREQAPPHWRRLCWLHRALGCRQADVILGVRR